MQQEVPFAFSMMNTIKNKTNSNTKSNSTQQHIQQKQVQDLHISQS